MFSLVGRQDRIGPELLQLLSIPVFFHHWIIVSYEGGFEDWFAHESAPPRETMTLKKLEGSEKSVKKLLNP